MLLQILPPYFSLQVLQQGAHFSWCGLDIHTSTLQIKGDFKRMANSHIVDSIGTQRRLNFLFRNNACSPPLYFVIKRPCFGFRNYSNTSLRTCTPQSHPKLVFVYCSNQPGREILRRLFLFIRQRFNVLYLSPALQSPFSAARNVFETVCIAAMRFHCYLKNLSAVSDKVGFFL